MHLEIGSDTTIQAGNYPISWRGYTGETQAWYSKCDDSGDSPGYTSCNSNDNIGIKF